jgi:SAM-dependent methyltransferase
VEHPRELLEEVARVLEPGGHFAGSTSQLEAFHSLSTFNWTPYGFARVAEAAGLEVVELRPVIDGFTLVARRALGRPRFFDRWWARESPPYRAIELAARARRLDARTRNQIKLILCGQFAFLARRP